jgi:peroxiredoxin (alkyl hydroperoxide reductase subunit C)
MGELWFEVVSDFWPHGRVSASFGVLRSDGTAERALILIDKKGVVRFAHVSDINVRPDLKMIVDELKKLK